jgi:sugar phosphate isomerase/epimerase
LTGAATTDRVGLFSSCLPGWDGRRVVNVARSLRFALIEWGAGPDQALGLEEDAAALRELCAAVGLAISGLSVQDHDVTVTTPRRALPYLRLASALGARFVRLFAPPYRGGSLAREQRRARGGLDAVIERAAPEGVAVLIETSPATLAPTPGLAAALVEHQAPKHAGVLYDPGNTIIEGYTNPALAVARLGPHLRHVHVKNIAWRSESGGWAWRYASLTGGLLVWPEILAALDAAGYRGGFSIDHLSGRPTRDRLRLETERLRALLSAGSPSPAATSDSTEKGVVPSPASA